MKRKLKSVHNNTGDFKSYIQNNKGVFIMLVACVALFLVLHFVVGTKINKAAIMAGAIYLIYMIPTLYRLVTHKPKHKMSKEERKHMWKKIGVGLIIFVTVVIVAFTAFFIMIAIKAPNFDPSQLYKADATTIYFSDGTEAGKVGSENRQNISYDDMSENLINAIIATEDSRFFQHNGFDLARFSIAAVKQILGNSSAGGASTLTMQVIKNTYTSSESKGLAGIIRKFTDIYMAIFKVEKTYTKEQILEFYVNSNYLGASSFGVEQASRAYFSKSAKDLTLPEAAMIAGLFNAPDYLDPLKYPERAERRRQTVLYQMYNHGYITEDEYNTAKTITVQKMLNVSSASTSNYQSVIDTVADEIETKLGVNPYTTSLQIYTTFDKSKQDSMNDVMNGTTFDWGNDKIQGGIVILNSQTGGILAVGANRNSNQAARQYNFATQIKKQIGSTAKPLYDYGPAIEFENWSTYSPVTDEPYHYSDGTSLSNWNRTYEGFLTSRTALSESRNIPAIKAFQANQQANIIKFVQGCGLSPEVKNGWIFEAHAIGGYDGESPLSMAAAYATFGNGGYYNSPYSVSKVVYTDTNDTWEYKSQKTRAMTEETAYMVYDMLRTACFHAIGYYCNMINSDVGVKTGTTNYDSQTIAAHPGWPSDVINDSWVDGVSSKYAVSVWYGYDRAYDDYVNTVNVGSVASWRLFYTVASFVFKGDNATVSKPDGVISVQIENQTNPGMLPSANTPSDQIVTELYRQGTEPTDQSPRFATLENVTNLKSSYSNGVVTLSWTPIATPWALDSNKINDLATSLFTDTGYRQSFIDARNNYNTNYMGTVVYKAYIEDSSGNLTSIGSTAGSSITYKLRDTSSTLKFVVKSSYTIFTAATSNGATVTYKPNGSEQVSKITATLNAGNSISVKVGESFAITGVKVLDGTTDVTASATVNRTIKDSNGKTYDSINTESANVYTITYEISYDSYSTTLTQTVTVK
jgi:penicillin-binding protein 1A